MKRTLPVLALLLIACGNSSAPAPSTTPVVSLFAPSGAVGDGCVTDVDCGSGRCDRTVPGGYCTAPCDSDDDCGGAAICDAGACLQRCSVQRECRSAEFECFDLGRADQVGACAFNVEALAPSTANIGAPCRAVVECLAPEGVEPYCIPELGYRGEATGHAGGFCTALGCSADADCGPSAVCVGAGSTPYCAPACSSSADCRDGYGCDAATSACAPATGSTSGN